jgi:hypothetical protein
VSINEALGRAIGMREMYLMGKMPPVVEDLRNHTPEHLAELRMLLDLGIDGRPDVRRPGFFEFEGHSNVYYVFKYPSGHKVLLVAVWQRQVDPVAEMVSLNRPAA